MKQVQITEQLFFSLCKYFIFEGELPEDEIKAIQKGMEEKIHAMQKRQLYTIYKDKSATTEARQKARKEYLDMVGMLPGFRWESLNPPQ